MTAWGWMRNGGHRGQPWRACRGTAGGSAGRSSVGGDDVGYSEIGMDSADTGYRAADGQRRRLTCCQTVGGAAGGAEVAAACGGGDDAVGGANMHLLEMTGCRSPWRGACDPGCRLHLHLGWMLCGPCRNHVGMEKQDPGAGGDATRRGCGRGDSGSGGWRWHEE